VKNRKRRICNLVLTANNSQGNIHNSYVIFLS